MNFKIRTNLTAGIVMAIAAVGLLITMPSQVRLPMFDSGAPSPRVIPGICLVGILLCAAILILQSLVLHKDTIYEFEWEKEKQELILIGLLLLFVAGTLRIGFVISGILIFSLIEFYSGERKPGMYLFTVAAVILIYLLFQHVFHVSLPNGILKGIM